MTFVFDNLWSRRLGGPLILGHSFAKNANEWGTNLIFAFFTFFLLSLVGGEHVVIVIHYRALGYVF
jgi:hypothetical protein